MPTAMSGTIPTALRSPVTSHNSVWSGYSSGNVLNSGGIDYIHVTDSYGSCSLRGIMNLIKLYILYSHMELLIHLMGVTIPTALSGF